MPTDITKREILFIYESTYSIPNGDPFTGEQRYDDDTKKVLVSDVRIKRFIRDYLENQGHDIFVSDKPLNTEDQTAKPELKESGASTRYKAICKKYGINDDPKEFLKKAIDVRLFGGIVTIKNTNINFTGPVQFALLNPSLNKVSLRTHQNTSVFVSSTEKKQGAIGTTTVVPYSINQIHGWVNPYAAKETLLEEQDVLEMLKALWKSVNLANTRSKSNQDSLLLLSINYKSPDDKIYKLDKSINIRPLDGIEEESIRSFADFDLNIDKLVESAQSDRVTEIQFYTENESIKSLLIDKDKFRFTSFDI
jgi:CRISPR-associated protein Csh2